MPVTTLCGPALSGLRNRHDPSLPPLRRAAARACRRVAARPVRCTDPGASHHLCFGLYRVGKTHKFRVEVAANDADRQRGLMYRREMAADAGMIFDFGYEQPVSMWMANTYIPLDMLFITADGKVAHVAARTVPESRATVSAPRPVRYVLELNGGTAERLGIKPGAQVRHAMLGNLR